MTQPSADDDAAKPNVAGGWLAACDTLTAVPANQSVARWANRALLCGLTLFALAVPHSIFAAHLGLNISWLAWLVRDLSLRKFHFRRTPLDLPLLCLIGLTVLSAIFSIEPAVSLPKLKALLLFGVVYLLATNMQPRAARWLLNVLLCSAVTSAGFSLLEKLYGRGMVITSIGTHCPLTVELSGSELQAGDVIWMIAKQRVYSLDDAAQIIRRHRPGEKLSVETLHEGDPLPVSLAVTAALQASENPLGITIAGRSRRFRVSGFTRQFLTYAEQMQMLALLCYGFLLSSGLSSGKRSGRRTLCWFSLFAIFSLTLVLTASRAVIAAFLLALSVVSLLAGGRRVRVMALLLVLCLSGLSIYVINIGRQSGSATLTDDSAKRRLEYMRAGLRLIPQHPWLGVGQDAHKLHWQEWGLPGAYVTHMHSTPIQLALDRGVPAMLCYLWLLVTLLQLAWRDYRHIAPASEAAGLPLGVWGAVLGFALSSLTNYNFGDAEVVLLLWLLAGLQLVNQAFHTATPATSQA